MMLERPEEIRPKPKSSNEIITWMSLLMIASETIPVTNQRIARRAKNKRIGAAPAAEIAAPI
jgi:hypothetical protein